MSENSFCIEDSFFSSPITDSIKQRIWNKSYKTDSNYDLSNLRYLTVLHYTFEKTICKGELIVNKRIAALTLDIFRELFESKYPIQQICLVDDFDADDDKSMAANNSSAFNYRFIDSTTILSNHSEGLAIDINPLYNPYIKEVNGRIRILPAEGACYADRTQNHPYFIRKGDVCYNAFISRGFSWGGDWEDSKDYQHFEYGMRKETPYESDCI